MRKFLLAVFFFVTFFCCEGPKEDFKIGQSVYVSNSDRKIHSVPIYVRYTPLTKLEVDELKMETWKKKKIENNLQEYKKFDFVNQELDIEEDEFFKRKTTLLGKFVSLESLSIKNYRQQWKIS